MGISHTDMCTEISECILSTGRALAISRYIDICRHDCSISPSISVGIFCIQLNISFNGVL